MSDGGSIRRIGKPRVAREPKGFEEAVLSDEEVLRRVDLREAAPQEPAPTWIGEASDEDPVRPGRAAAALGLPTPAIESADAGSIIEPVPGPASEPGLQRATPTQRVQATRRSRAAEDDKRRLLWRDSATILIGVVLALLVGQTLVPSQAAGPDGSPSPDPSTIAIGSFGPPVSIPPAATFGPIVDPSLGVDASPTPIPVITMGPTPSPSPSLSPSPSIRPSPSIKPSAKPTAKPTPRPTRTPTPTPRPATPTPPPPPPSASFSWTPTSPTVGESVQFSNSSTGGSSYAWTFGDGDTSTASEPSHTYALPDTYTVTLTVTGPGGEDVATDTITVAVLP